MLARRVNQTRGGDFMHLSDVPCWLWMAYLSVAFAWSAYQGYRGAVEQRVQHQGRERDLKVRDCQIDASLAGALAAAHLQYQPRPRWERWVVLYIHDFAFRFVCTLAGFIALFVAYQVTDSLSTRPGGLGCASPGGAALLVLMFLIGVIGVGGQLHYVILVGKWPKQ
jgi:hypothetical protein